MRTFAEIDENNFVVNVAVFSDDAVPSDSEKWVETSDGLHNRIAGPGDQYVAEADGYDNGLFYQAAPPLGYESWVLNSAYEWEPPPDQPYPEGYGVKPNTWWWDPVLQAWDQKEFIQEEKD